MIRARSRLTGGFHLSDDGLRKTRTAKVRFELDNTDEKLKPDRYANVELQVKLGTRLAIPQEAIIERDKKQAVFLHLGGEARAAPDQNRRQDRRVV
ncbi:MAG: hypothetical protein U0231_12450 [Nitrospiraceae bacterium]